MPPLPPTPSPARDSARPEAEAPDFTKVGDALYLWCVENTEVGNVLLQQDLMKSPVIPDKDGNILLGAVQYLVDRRLLKVHVIKESSSLAWELVSQAHAAKYGYTSSRLNMEA